MRRQPPRVQLLTKAVEVRILRGPKRPAEKASAKLRNFRNGIGLTVPSEDQIEILRWAVRYLLSIKSVQTKAKQLGLTDAQKSQLRVQPTIAHSLRGAGMSPA